MTAAEPGHGWIRVPEWDNFQHYKDRVPKWIKLHVELLDDDDFIALTPSRQAMLVKLWSAYARGREQLTSDPRRLSHVLRQRVTVSDLKALRDAGFIEILLAKPEHRASKPLALTRADARSREGERENPSSLSLLRTPRDDPKGANADPTLEGSIDARSTSTDNDTDVDPEAAAKLRALASRVGKDVPR